MASITSDDGSASASADLAFPPSPKATACGFALGLPRFKFGFKLPSINFPPPIPLPFIAFKLQCDLSKPVDVTAGLNNPPGGGRPDNAPDDPDDNDDTP